MTGSTTVRDFLYPLSSSSGYILDAAGGDFDCSAEGFRRFREALGPRRCEWRIATNFRNVSEGDRVWVYFAAPDGFIGAVGTVCDTPHLNREWKSKAIWIEWDDELTRKLQESPIPYSSFQQRIQGAVSTPSRRTMTAISRWLKTHESAPHRGASEEVRRVRREVQQRLGQREFRDALRSAYGDRCVITGTSLTELLEAAHITPVSLGGRHSTKNGLLLRADLHTLFDLGFLTVDDDRRVRVHPAAADYSEFDGRVLRSPARRSDAPLLTALREHRQRSRLMRNT